MNRTLLRRNRNSSKGSVSLSRQTPNTNTGWVLHRSSLTVGIIKVVRTGGGTLNNANAGSAGVASDTSLYLKNYDDYKLNFQSDSGWYWAAQNPGQWANNLKVCMIDDAADQTLTLAPLSGIDTTALTPGAFGLSVGQGVTVGLSTNIASVGFGTSGFDAFSGHLKGIITRYQH